MGVSISLSRGLSFQVGQPLSNPRLPKGLFQSRYREAWRFKMIFVCSMSDLFQFQSRNREACRFKSEGVPPVSWWEKVSISESRGLSFQVLDIDIAMRWIHFPFPSRYREACRFKQIRRIFTSVLMSCFDLVIERLVVSSETVHIIVLEAEAFQSRNREACRFKTEYLSPVYVSMNRFHLVIERLVVSS